MQCKRSLPAIFLFLAFTAIAAISQTVPNITSLSPGAGPVGPIGVSVTIAGSGFGNAQGTSTVSFGGIIGSPSSWSDSQIVLPVPYTLPTGYANVFVTVNGTASNTTSFLVIPVITAVSPEQGTIGSSVTITGTSFGTQQNGSTVTFNGTSANPTSWSNTSITLPVPAGTGDESVAVTVNGFSTNTADFFVLPNITALSPASGSAGALVTVSGTAFGPSQGFGSVSFNGLNGAVQSWSDTSISVTVPSGVTTGSVIVTTGLFLTSSGVNFAAGPQLTGISPSGGGIGTQLTITGSGFGATQGSGTATIGGTNLLILSWSDTQITAVVGSGSATGNVVVQQGGQSNGIAFTVQPAIVTLSPPSGAIGSLVTILGSGFGSTAGTLTFNGSAVSPSTWSDGRVQFQVPPSGLVGSAPVALTTSASLSIGPSSFIVTPGINIISPNSGNQGTTFTIQGSNFGSAQGSSVLTLAGVSIQPSAWASTQITAAVPSGASTGPVVVTVSNIASNPMPFNVPCIPALSSIAVSPGSIATFSGMSVPVSVINDCGQPVTGVTWNSSDTTIAAITVDTPPRIYGVTPGTTTVTASYSGLTAQATVTVYPSGSGFTDGTAIHSQSTFSDSNFTNVVRAIQTANASTGLFYIDDRFPNAVSVRAATLTGTQLWRLDFPGGAFSYAPDNNGGLILSLASPDESSITVTSVDANGNQQWDYQYPVINSGAQLIALFHMTPSIAVDGTVYLVQDNDIVALDGTSGLPKFYVPLSSAPSFSVNDNTPVAIMPNGQACIQVSELPLGSNTRNLQAWPVVLNLACANRDGSYSSTPLSTLIASFDTDSLLPGWVIPDGNGGTVTNWTTVHTTSSGPVSQFTVASSAGQATLQRSCGSGNVRTLPPMVLDENGPVYLVCPQNPSDSTPPTLYAFNGGAATWSWSATQNHDVELLGTVAGGGVRVIDSTGTPPGNFGQAVQATVVDLDTSGNPTSETWSASSTSGMVYLGDGMFASSTSSSISLIVDASNDSDSDSDWAEANAVLQGRHRAPTVEFAQDQECSGFDETLDPHMLPVGEGLTNTVKVKIHGQLSGVQFISQNTDVVTVSPATPTGDTTTLTVMGLNPNSNPVEIRAVSSTDPATVYGSLVVVVKPSLATLNFHVYSVTESVRQLTPQHVPSPSSLGNELNLVTWGNQVNVGFNIQPNTFVNLSVHYDLLPAPNGDGTLNDIGPTRSTVESAAIAQAVLAQDPQAGTFDHTTVAYINKFGPAAGTTCTNCIIEGETNDGSHFSFVEDPQEANSNSRETIIAHEIGHGMNVNLHDVYAPPTENKSLMWYQKGQNDPVNPCRIRDREWQLVNPTPGDGAPRLP